MVVLSNRKIWRAEDGPGAVKNKCDQYFTKPVEDYFKYQWTAKKDT